MRWFRAHAAAIVTVALLAPGASAAGLVGLQSPSKNIGCYVDADAARCDISKHDWPTPRKPASCDLDYGSGLAISKRGTRGSFVCAGDTALGAGKVLGYGRSIKRGGITCTSRESGMTCKNAKGHGFTLSRGSYKRF